jgi:hypothetical protein
LRVKTLKTDISGHAESVPLPEIIQGVINRVINRIINKDINNVIHKKATALTSLCIPSS